MIRVFNQYVSIKSLLLMVIETFLIALSLVCAVKLRFWNNPADLAAYISFPDFAVQIGIVVVVCLICFYCNDLYDLSSGCSPVERVLRVEQSLGASSLLLGLVYFLLPGLLLSRGVFVISMVLLTGFVLLTRKGLDKVWQLTAPAQRVAILGTGQLALEVARELTRRGDLSMKVEGLVSSASIASAETGSVVFGLPVLGSGMDMERIARQHGISRIIVALEDRRGVLPTRDLVKLRVQGIRVDDAPTALAALTGRISLRAVRPSWFVFSDGFHRSKWTDVLKRAMDLAGGIIGLILSAPIMVLVSVAVRLDSKGPVIYRQTRVARKGELFEVLKFRSMRVDAENGSGAQWAVENDPRVTRVGRFLRDYRLDELPQFVNVIRGDMSFVGPRPERPEFVEELRNTIPYYDERHSVRPGLTGWAQVQYSYGSSVEDAFNKLEFDLFYLKNMSLGFDFAILFQTIRIVVRGRGAR
jgi:sugar transferase (PEP-CTERM system associated)